MSSRLIGLLAVIGMVIAACGGGVPEATGDGPAEGIQVHGHWIVDVYNSDGSLDKRHEFDNRLTAPGIQFLGEFLASGASRVDDQGVVEPLNVIWDIFLRTEDTLCPDGQVPFGGSCFDLSTSWNEFCPPNTVFYAGACFDNLGVFDAGMGAFFSPASDLMIISREFVSGEDLPSEPLTIFGVETVVFPIPESVTETDVTVFTRADLSDPIPVAPGQDVDVRVEISFATGS